MNRLNRTRLLKSLLLFALLLGFGSLAAAVSFAAPSAYNLQNVQTVEIVAKDFSFEMPAQLEAGPTHFTQRNEGAALHHAQLTKIKEGHTLEEAMGVLASGNVEAFFGLVEFYGGPSIIAPGAANSAIVDLTEGTYLVLCFIEEEGVPHLAKGMLTSFKVLPAEGESSASAEADQNVSLADFAFVMPREIPAGEQVWDVSNNGPQIHEINVFRLAPGATSDQVLGFFRGEAGGPPPFIPLGGIQALDAGQSNQWPIDLEPGDYVAVCLIPDPATGKSHAELGMFTPFSVTGEQVVQLAQEAPTALPETGVRGNSTLLLAAAGALLLLIGAGVGLRRRQVKS